MRFDLLDFDNLDKDFSRLKQSIRNWVFHQTKALLQPEQTAECPAIWDALSL
jgi:hypothetical protein